MSAVNSVLVRGLHLTGAYGRETSLKDWVSGKDFKIIGGPYCTVRDLQDIWKEFQIVEFRKQDGTLIERLIHPGHPELKLQGTFKRVLDEG